MHWLRRLFKALPAGGADQARWVVLDCESSGLDPQADRLLSIGAVAVEGGRIDIGSSFSVVLRQARPSDAANIAIHGISGSEQVAGIDPGEGLRSFASYAGDSPLVAFHAPFDRALLRRSVSEHGIGLKNPWLDLAVLAPALYPQHARRCKALDDWLGAFGIDNPARHDALADAYATALLFQVLLAAARAQGAHGVRDVIAVAQGGHWLAAGH